MRPPQAARVTPAALVLLVVLVLFVATATAPATAAPATTSAHDIDAGERLYRQGIRPDGSPVQATRAQVGGVVAGQAAACVACHRRSAMGMQEGRLLAPPVAGAILFKPGAPLRPTRPATAGGTRRAASAAAQAREPARHLARAAYDVASLTRALRDGVDPSGRPLDALMPRYALDQAEVAQLTAYLNQLDPQQASGLGDPGLIHLATVITPDAPARRRSIVVDTLRHWADAVALRGRRVRLQVWQLDGAASTWRAQLERLQARQPVYAVVSGAGRADWRPVQDFCEASRLPCVLPLVDQVPGGAGDPATPSVDEPYYSLYFSAGVDAEAQLAARYLMALPAAPDLVEPATGPAPLLQVVAPGDPLGAAAARRFAATWPEAGHLTTLELDANAPDAGTRLLHALGAQNVQGTPITPITQDGSIAHQPAVAGSTPVAGAVGTRDPSASPRSSMPAASRLVLWVEPAQLQAWVARFPAGIPGVATMLVSAQLTPALALTLPPAWQRQLAWVSLKSDPTRLRAGQALVVSNWLAHLGLRPQAGSEQAEVYAAAFFVGDALARMRLGWSQTWLMEQLEVVVNNRPAGAAYYSLSLGPGQRVAAKVGRVLAVAPATAPGGDTNQPVPWQDRLAPVSDLIRADD